ncbi:alpha/beta hydrolase [Marmoricola endophyticus]|uniref:alpha/beta hydrolase n=1 Tax=Marmoricola endophyticus TaxID=2040280 RepID=UPI001E5A6B26|nr:alpha/beta fold hydrolase [Marmoricola endophyticus]
MRTDETVDSSGTPLAVWHYEAGSDTLATAAGRPCVVMAHGFGATRADHLAPYAERFAAAGLDVMVFDYRGFGDSGTESGVPRQLVDHRRHRADYHAVLAHARSTPGVDPDRVAVWGSSYSGGHVVAVAAQDPRVAAVVSQGAAMDGAAAVLQILSYAGPLALVRLSGHALLDAARGVLRRSPHEIAIYAAPGGVAAMTSPDSESGYGGIVGPDFVNRMPARAVLPIALNRPVRLAPRVRVPMLLVVAGRDSVAPPSAVEKVARTAGGPVRTERFEVGHFEIYLGEVFERSVAAQVEFLTEALQA